MTAQTPQPMAVSLDQITLDPRAWPREALDEERVELFAELIRDAHDAAQHSHTGWADPLPPLVVVADGRGGYVLADGRHRYEARRRLGEGFGLVQVQVFQSNVRAPVDFAYELALMCTLGAKPLTTAEKRAAIARLIGERRELSDRAVARLVGVSPSTVGAHRSTVGAHRSTVGVDRVGASNLDTAPDRRGETNDADRRDRLRWEVAAERLADDVTELLRSCRKLLGGPDFKSAGRELYKALADYYGDDEARTVIDELSAVVGGARAHATKADV